MAERVSETGSGKPSADVSELSVSSTDVAGLSVTSEPVAPGEDDFSLPQPSARSARRARRVAPTNPDTRNSHSLFAPGELAVLPSKYALLTASRARFRS